ncbi:MAG: sensor histidine kinase [Acidimicrobiales bacterium]
MSWIEEQLERMRSLDQRKVDAVMAVALLLAGVGTVFSQELDDAMVEPTVISVLTAFLVAAPIAVRRRRPLAALAVASAGILAHIVANWPEGTLPLTVMLLTYSVAAYDTPRRAGIGLGIVFGTLIVIAISDAPGLDAVGIVGNMAIFTVWWVIGMALRARRDALEARVSAAEERANVERQSAARALAEERLRIAQELHDVVAHSMSVIAVQAGVGAHVLTDRPDQARAALDAISATSRGTLTEMRRLLGVLRDDEGERSDGPAPGLGDLPTLVDDVRKAGVPVTLTLIGTDTCPDQGTDACAHAGVELSAYRVVQEALTNVMKHAGRPGTVDVTVRYVEGGLEVEVADDGRGAATPSADSGGHGLVGMRERVELWGGALSAGPAEGGGYRVSATLPFGRDE